MSIVLHYFFLASFLWLMNEAFNLYMAIAYAAHSHGEHTDGGAQWRFYILGWSEHIILWFNGKCCGSSDRVPVCTSSK
jgi:7 transmembrane receptor (Secretin family)